MWLRCATILPQNMRRRISFTMNAWKCFSSKKMEIRGSRHIISSTMSRFFTNCTMDVGAMNEPSISTEVETADDRRRQVLNGRKLATLHLEQGARKNYYKPHVGVCWSRRDTCHQGKFSSWKADIFHILSGLLISNNLRGQVLVNGRLVNWPCLRRQTSCR